MNDTTSMGTFLRQGKIGHERFYSHRWKLNITENISKPLDHRHILFKTVE